MDPHRIKRRLAFLIISGQRNSYIRKTLHITQSTLEQYLNHPVIQETIEQLEREVYEAAERQFQYLLIESTEETRKLIKDPQSDPEVKLKAIDMTWRAHGRLLQGKGTEVSIQNQQLLAQQGGGDLDREDAGNILQILKEMRKSSPAVPVLPGTQSGQE